MLNQGQLDGMGKLALRSACRDAKIPGYGKMRVADMRAALAQVTTGNGEAPTAAKVETATATAKGKKKAAAPIKVEKDRDERNGIKRPSAGGACDRVWQWLDKHPDAQLKDVRAQAERAGWNANNAAIELYQWRKWAGVASKRTK